MTKTKISKAELERIILDELHKRLGKDAAQAVEVTEYEGRTLDGSNWGVTHVREGTLGQLKIENTLREFIPSLDSKYEIE